MIESHVKWFHETGGNNKYKILWYEWINNGDVWESSLMSLHKSLVSVSADVRIE